MEPKKKFEKYEPAKIETVWVQKQLRVFISVQIGYALEVLIHNVVNIQRNEGAGYHPVAIQM